MQAWKNGYKVDKKNCVKDLLRYCALHCYSISSMLALGLVTGQITGGFFLLNMKFKIKLVSVSFSLARNILANLQCLF